MSWPAAVASCKRGQSRCTARNERGDAHLDEMVSNHIANAPALVGDHGLHGRPQQTLALFVVECFGDIDHSIDSEQPDGVLVVSCQFAESGKEV
jgi:hypothetical protein